MTNNFEHLSASEFEDLKRVFYSQAYEIAENLQELLLGMETNPDDVTIKTIRRHLHTLKGDANSFGLGSIGTLCHTMEDVISSAVDSAGGPGHEVVDLLLECIDTITSALAKSEAGADATDVEAVIGRINTFLGHTGEQQEKKRSAQVPYTEYQELQIRDTLEKGFNVFELEVVFHPMCGEKGLAAFMVAQRLNSMGHIIRSLPDMESSEMDHAESMTLLFGTRHTADEIRGNASIVGITADIHVGEYAKAEKTISAPGYKAAGIKSQVLMIESSKVDRVMNFVGELIIGRSVIDSIARDAADGVTPGEVASRLSAANAYIERTVSDLQKSVMKMRMVPINYVFRKFPKIIRDLSSGKQKLVRLEMRGRETELDKGVVDALGEPLAHIIRNLIDHGIESPEYRRSTGKNEEGTITLRAYHEGAQLVIEASDDGRGIDAESLRKKAVEKGFFSEGDAALLSDGEAVNLMFLPGLSTSEKVDEVSGRGIGMSAVKSAVEGLRGTIEIESASGKGTTFRLRLPLTLAVIKALLFEVGERIYSIAVSAVSEVTRIVLDDLATVDGKDTLMLRDRIISLVHLNELFGISRSSDRKKFVLILAAGGKNIGLVTDRLLGQQELVIKAVDPYHVKSDLVAGASILGNGRVVLILDAAALIRKAVDDERKRLVAL